MASHRTPRITRSELERIVAELVERAEQSGNLPKRTGGAVAVVQDADVVYQGTFGLRDRARGLAVTSKTVFDVGSLTKTMTSSALMLAHERGKLDLDQPLRARTRVLQLRDPEAADLSLADVLSHRVGLPAHDFLWYFGGHATRELASRLRHLESVPNRFRKTFVYNNALYGCTQLVIEDILACSWEELVTSKLLRPLGMNATTLSDGSASDDQAQPYLHGQLTKRKSMAPVAPAGAARSTIEDMAGWALFQLGQRGDIVNKRSLSAMHATKISAAGASPLILSGLEWLGPPAYGYGWFLGEAHGEKAVYHMGLVDGFSSAMVLFPGLSLGFVVLVNDNLSGFPGMLVEQLFARFTGHEPTRSPMAPEAPAPSALPAQVSAPRGVEGTYEDPAYGHVTVSGDGYSCRLAYGSYEWPLRFHAPTEATFTVFAFGLDVSLSASFADNEISIPFSLDPRVSPQVFKRSSGTDGGESRPSTM
ncbi:MAG TPA: serine hydrolase domain-containing protein [Labilithrix sp.]|jgi:CubicO group peptidase (beta-lactamase class C family)|nr:serine hydrolase domain-containing protein [Labilithrix sp.]